MKLEGTMDIGNMVNIAVVGGGIIGLTTAYRLVDEIPAARVTVISRGNPSN